MRLILCAGVLLLAACKPEASESHAARQAPEPAVTMASEGLPSPDTQGAVWAPAGEQRLVYGKPGEAPLMTLACSDGNVVIERLVRADEGAKGVLAMIGNAHVVRLFVDAEPVDDSPDAQHRWIGRFDAANGDLDVLSGTGQVEATIPGAGSVILNPSGLPGELIAACRSPGLPASPA